MKTTSSYFICTLPRSGSWLLADLLECTNVAGRPREYFELPDLWKNGEFPNETYIRKVRRTATTSNGVLGMKFHWHQFDYLVRMMRRQGNAARVPAAGLVAEAFPDLRYVWLTRRDKVRQAISYFRAIHTGEWWKVAGEEPESPGPPHELIFDFAAIECLEKMLMEHDHCWQRYFEESNLDPLVLVYEELNEVREPIVRETLDFLRIPFPCNRKLRTILAPQADSMTEEWADRYRTLKRARSSHTTWFLRAISTSPRQPSFIVKDTGTRLDRVEAGSGASAPLPLAPDRRRSFANGCEFCIAAPQRSGHHGIINWLAGQCRGTVLYLNDAQPATNPFFTCTVGSRLDLPGTPKVERTQMNLFDHRDFLFVSYEDRRLEDVFCEAFERSHDAWIGTSGQRRQIVILRDAFNTFASRARASWMRHKLTDADGRDGAVRLWKSYAKAVAARRAMAASGRVFVNYNLWVHSQDYRREIAAELDLEFNDQGRNVVSGTYGGSSFDGVAFNGAADQMRVLERWKDVVDDPAFRDLFRDRELVELSNEVFGPIQGTEVLAPVEVSVGCSSR